MTLLDVVLSVLGIAALIAGAEFLVRGASRLAAAVGISPLVVGLTVVAFGTSAPELAVCVGAALDGQGDLALGNVAGSNILNVLVVLGISACITPMTVSRQLVRLDVPVMIGVSVLLYLALGDSSLDRLEGLLFLAGSVIYTFWIIRLGRKEKPLPSGEGPTGPATVSERKGARPHLVNAAFIVVGLVLLPLGAKGVVDGAVLLAKTLGMSEVLVGLTIVALGTSLPEIATCVIASLKGERDLAVGNVVGSNIFNILLVLGATGALAPREVEVPASLLRLDLPFMIAVAAACLPIFFTGHRINRWEGVMFLGYYAAYVIYLVLGARGHAALPAYSTVMLGFVAPITALTLLVLSFRYARSVR